MFVESFKSYHNIMTSLDMFEESYQILSESNKLLRNVEQYISLG
jgi:hypothetical protein